MNKFTLFTLSVCTIIIVIVAEILVNDYLRTPAQIDGSANVLQSQSAGGNSPAPTPPTAGVSSQTQAASNSQAALGSIYTALLKKAGLGSYIFQVVPFDGKLFGSIAFNALNFIPSYESYLTKNQIANVAIFDEFNPDSLDSATQFYALVKQTCTNAPGVILNETNSFGDSSFYANFIEYPQRVFLVFRKDKRVFAFSYDKDLHGDIVNLIGLL